MKVFESFSERKVGAEESDAVAVTTDFLLVRACDCVHHCFPLRVRRCWSGVRNKILMWVELWVYKARGSGIEVGLTASSTLRIVALCVCT